MMLPAAESSFAATGKGDARMLACRKAFGPTVYSYEVLKNGRLRCSYRIQPRNAAEARTACSKANFQGHTMVNVRKYADGTWACMVK
ncbi:MAG: hypothetical protein HY245_05330 [Rhizobiales bacterium]|nr:hypothetical protein [Hyphomicrobiales bacterium]MBI3672835.1 hypothetical protein [Hyphomicrobiales bacterium]